VPKHNQGRRRGHGYRSGGGDPNAGLAALLGLAAQPGYGRWSQRHGGKVAQPFCQALKAARHVRQASITRGDLRRINVYPCTDGPSCDATPELRRHWHVGHLRHGRAHATGVVLI